MEIPIDKTVAPGHWMTPGAQARSVRHRRRREYVRTFGKPPAGVRLRLTCGVKGCVNPKHCQVAVRGAAADKIVKAFKANDENVDDTAAELGLSLEYLKKLLRDQGAIEPLVHRPEIDEAMLARAEVLMRDGVPNRWIAEDLNVTVQTVETIRTKLRIPLDREWVRVQLACRKIKALAPLHELFNPQIGVT